MSVSVSVKPLAVDSDNKFSFSGQLLLLALVLRFVLASFVIFRESHSCCGSGRENDTLSAPPVAALAPAVTLVFSAPFKLMFMLSSAAAVRAVELRILKLVFTLVLVLPLPFSLTYVSVRYFLFVAVEGTWEWDSVETWLTSKP